MTSQQYQSDLFKLDNFPSEIGWTLISLEENKLWASKPVGSYVGMNYQVEIEKITLPVSRNKNSTFTFVIYDTGGDGLCCEKGFGFFQILLGDLRDQNVIINGGEFHDSEEFQLVFDQASELHVISKLEEELQNSSQSSASHKETSISYLVLLLFLFFLCRDH